jgi:RNA polymerase sigma-70 factor (ECF subfamily)
MDSRERDGTVTGRRAAQRIDEYDDLYRRNQARILRLCTILLRNPSEAEDVTQEVFLILFREQQRGERRVGWAPWLTRVAVNACHRRRRSRWWDALRAQPTLDAAELATDTPTPELQAIGSEQRRAIRKVFATLSARQQEVFLLRHVEGYSTDDVAEMLGVRTGSVKQHLFRATHAFQRALQSTGAPQ